MQYYKKLATAGLSLLISFQIWSGPGLAQSAMHEPLVIEAAQEEIPDPLKGLDLKKLEEEKKRLVAQKTDPNTALFLSAIPGVGHMYSGLSDRGVWVLGGFAATILLSFLAALLINSLNNNTARTAAVVVNIAPPIAYLAWESTDAYYQTAWRNHKIDDKIREITLKQNEYGYYTSLLRLEF